MEATSTKRTRLPRLADPTCSPRMKAALGKATSCVGVEEITPLARAIGSSCASSARRGSRPRARLQHAHKGGLPRSATSARGDVTSYDK